MGDLAVIFTPSGESTELTCDFGDISNNPYRLAGYAVTDRAHSISVGGKSVSLAFDTFFRYDLEVRSLTFPPSTEATRNFWGTFNGWLSHAERGGQFALAIDDTNTTSMVTSFAEAQGSKSIQVDDSTGFAAGDWLLIEDANDPTKWEKFYLNNITPGTPDDDLELYASGDGLSWSYAAGSTVRHHEYFPTCVLEPQRMPPLIERNAGRGANVWDLKFRFRTVR